MTGLALETDLTAEQRDYMETVRLSADGRPGVIDDILDFSKIEAGRIDLEEVAFSLRDSVEAALRTRNRKADEHGIELLCDIDADGPGVLRWRSNAPAPDTVEPHWECLEVHRRGRGRPES